MTYQFKDLLNAFPAVAQTTLAPAFNGRKANVDRAWHAKNGDREWHNNIRDLVASLVAKGLTDDEIHLLDAGMTMTGFTIEDTSREVQKFIDTARAKGFDQSNNAPEQSIRRSKFFRASALDGLEVPERPWLVDSLVPKKTVTSLAGDGGVGKSLLALQLAASVASGKSWLNNPVQCGAVLFLSAEDDQDELHRRTSDVARGMSLSLADLNDLHIRSLAGEDAVLAAAAANSQMQATPLFKEVWNYVEEIKPELVILDTLADLFAGNENDRGQARQFIGFLRGLAIRQNCAVVLLAHPSLSGLNSGSGTGGSTAWNNSVRSRLYLTRVVEGGYEADPNARLLRVMKSNYGKVGAEVNLTWQNGIFVGNAPLTGLDRLAVNSKAERVFLALLREFHQQGRKVNHAGGYSYAPKAFEGHPKSEGVAKPAFKRAMDSLLASNKIAIAEDGPPSKRRSFLVLVD